jgi:hypothetical protein
MRSRWWWLYGMIVFCSWELALSNDVIIHPLSVIVCVEINVRHCFWSSLINIRTYSLQLHVMQVNPTSCFPNSWNTCSSFSIANC